MLGLSDISAGAHALMRDTLDPGIRRVPVPPLSTVSTSRHRLALPAQELTSDLTATLPSESASNLTVTSSTSEEAHAEPTHSRCLVCHKNSAVNSKISLILHLNLRRRGTKNLHRTTFLLDATPNGDNNRHILLPF